MEQRQTSLLRNRVFVGSASFVIVAAVALAILAYAIRGGSNTSFRLALPLGGKIELASSKQLSVSKQQVGSFDSSHYFISSDLGFVFRKPTTPLAWSPVTLYNGLPPDQTRFLKCLIGGRTGAGLVTRTVVQTAGRTVPVTMTNRTTVDIYGTNIKAGLKRNCVLRFQNGIYVEIFPKARLRKLTQVDFSLPAFLSYAISGLGIRLDKLIANPNQILATWTYRLQHARIGGRESSFTEYRAFSFTQTRASFVVTEIAFSPNSDSSPDRWSEAQQMLDSFRLIGSQQQT
jgi:hypothetical protein